MTINDGGGLFDKFGMIQSCINDLSKVPVCGYEYMELVLSIRDRLYALKKGLKDDEKYLTEEEI